MGSLVGGKHTASEDSQEAGMGYICKLLFTANSRQKSTQKETVLSQT
jgi:hypothetical protein